MRRWGALLLPLSLLFSTWASSALRRADDEIDDAPSQIGRLELKTPPLETEPASGRLNPLPPIEAPGSSPATLNEISTDQRLELAPSLAPGASQAPNSPHAPERVGDSAIGPQSGNLIPGAPAQAPVLDASPAQDETRIDFDGESPDKKARLLRGLLGDGTLQPDGSRTQAFVFHAQVNSGERLFKARSTGIEGFAWSKAEIEAALGKETLLHHAQNDYCDYLIGVLTPAARRIPAVAKAVERLKEFKATTENIASTDASSGKFMQALWHPLQKMFSVLTSSPKATLAALSSRNDEIDGILAELLPTLRKMLEASGQSQWAQRARIYEIYSGVYHLPGRRQWLGKDPGPGDKKFFADFSDEDLADIRSISFDTVWTMGIYPVGKRERHGAGSLYSIRDYSINPKLGTEQDLKAFAQRVHHAGMHFIIDFVPNHTSMDSALLATHPEFFIYREVEGDPQHAPEGYFPYFSELWNRWIWVSYGGYDAYGHKAYWNDVAQLNVFHPGLRDYFVEMLSHYAELGVDGFRVDMAYQDTNRYFSKNWKLPPLEKEFFQEIIERVRSRYPKAGFIAESYDLHDELSAMGFDAVYNKSDMDLQAGQYGWYDAWMKRDIQKIREAIRYMSFSTWQRGAAAAVPFINNHDEAAAQAQYFYHDGKDHPSSGLGRLWMAAALLTLLLPGSLLFLGSGEIGFNRPDPKDLPKPLSFWDREPIDWQGYASSHPEFASYFKGAFEHMHEAFSAGATRMQPLEPKDEGRESWVGFMLHSPEDDGPRFAALANPTDQDIDVHLQDDRLGVHIDVTLPANQAQFIRL